ncbi:diphthine--ammonia ligase [Mesobacillus maritimus]|uniref:Dph6-related ATP pyrophosphatase n=1 Tax=Mesobacillus maritimus TaxID=1643336 RepID=UPI00203BCA89|nr:diphthine--ammonia ligase [Mesobacillus maritimus]MCM3668628.1 diphthine--ammonia ligase [Mesobacillus maritimus]
MKKLALSWSGGKDACLALDVLTTQGIEVACLVTTVPKELGRTFGHGEKMELIKLQGEALGIPVHFIQCTFEDYTDRFVGDLMKLKKELRLTGVAFGDLYFEPHREWGEKVAAQVGVEAVYPLWMEEKDRLKALETFIQTGYQSTVIRVREEMLDSSWLGRNVDFSFYHDIQSKNVCPMGEAGEYHTFTYDGPLFKRRLVLEHPDVIELETTKKLEFRNYYLESKSKEE